jgi:hypothetical protein
MSKDITPADSIVPIYLEPLTKEQIEFNEKQFAQIAIEKEKKAQAKTSAQAKLAAIGLTVEDLTALGL